MKKFLLSIVCVLLVSLAFAQDNPNAPVFKFAEETHNFGDIKEGADATFDFVFTNTGKEPLIIQDCKASCGCTTPDWPKTPILPGQRGKITVKYDTKNRVGTFTKSVFIASNAKPKDPSEKRYEIIIKGNVLGNKETQVTK